MFVRLYALPTVIMRAAGTDYPIKCSIQRESEDQVEIFIEIGKYEILQVENDKYVDIVQR